VVYDVNCMVDDILMVTTRYCSDSVLNCQLSDYRTDRRTDRQTKTNNKLLMSKDRTVRALKRRCLGGHNKIDNLNMSRDYSKLPKMPWVCPLSATTQCHKSLMCVKS